MTDRRTTWARRFWRLVNPITRPVAGYLPWWVLVEATGRRTGKRRRTPFADGVLRDGSLWLISVHGSASALAHNIRANPEVRVKRRGRWHAGRAELVALSDDQLAWFSHYAKAGLRTFGRDPMLLKIELHDSPRGTS